MPPPADLPRLPRRDPQSHKGTYGTVAIVGGCCGGGGGGTASPRMIGAPALAATAALRAGAGLVRIAAPDPILAAALTIAPGATGIPIPTGPDGAIFPHHAAAVIDTLVRTCTCLAIGPGLGPGDGPRAAALRAVQQEDIPVVVDADALNALAQVPQLARDLHAAAVLTPHPGEFRRLTDGMGLKDHLGLSQSRELAAECLAQRLACIVVLKGAGTVVSDGTRTWTNTSGHSCLATAGTGDVLTGLLSALIAQFVTLPPTAVVTIAATDSARPAGRPLDLFDAARIAVYIHGLAGENWARARGAQAGLLATDLPDLIPPALESLRSP